MSRSVFEFSHAITRRPGENVIHGLRARDTGAPDPERMRRAHDSYVAALKSTGADVHELPPLKDFADGLFVEDTALCLAQGAVLMRPGAPSRVGEVAHMAPVLGAYYRDIRAIKGPGTIEGGDILVTGREILVGRSARTNAAGIAELTDIVTPWGYRVREVATPADVLHLKTDCALLDAGTILCTERLAASGCFSGYRVVHTARGEEAAANVVRFNDLVLFPAGFARTAQKLRDGGYTIIEIDNAECARLDGGMSCLSLRFC